MKELAAEHDEQGSLFVCATCRGTAATMPALRNRLEAKAASDLWARARAASSRGGRRPCPSCSEAMGEVVVTPRGEETVLDACVRCQIVWFDEHELDLLPKAPRPPSRRLSPDAAEAYGRLVTRRRNESIVEVDPFSTESLAGAAGLPTLVGAPDAERRPFAIWGLAAAILSIALVTIVAGFRRGGLDGIGQAEQAAADAWGFVPAKAFRHGGLTFVTAFFLHGGWLHVLFNAYFLVLAGSPIESAFGRARAVLLVLASTLVGSIAHGLANWGSNVPAIGASDGIAGLFAYFALALPRVRIGVVLWGWRLSSTSPFMQVRIPVRWVFFGWFALETIYSMSRHDGVSHISHVGGALAGLAWWLVERRLGRAPLVEAS